jgi:hypothetical protein
MKIVTKFDVNNLVKRKFDTDSKNQIHVLEVMEVASQTCYAGTQVFYFCKPIIARKEFAEKYLEKGESTWVICHGVSQEENQAGWRKYREDELVEVPNESIDIILGKSA